MMPSIPSGNDLDAVLEEILTRLDNGGEPDPSEYVTRYPEHATELREFFSDVRFVDRNADDNDGTRSVPTGCRPHDPWMGRGASRIPNEEMPVDAPAIDGFRIFEELGLGSQGVVYKAEQLGAKRTVALKVIRQGAFASWAERRRFQNEVELASRLNHPNIVAIYACGRDHGCDYFAMEYVEGEPLDLYVATRALDHRAVVALFLQICDAVSFAHQRGVIHRDIKPSNVLVDTSGQAHILDFGLAKPIMDGSGDARTSLTELGGFAGTWYYASPEQTRRDTSFLDVRSDVYTLGVILFEMMTGAYPYPIEDEPRDIIAQHIQETAPTRPSSLRRHIDDDLETIILRALRKEPERRYQSAAALGEDVRRYLAGEAIEAKRESTMYVLRKALKRYRSRVALAAIALTALIAFAVTVSILYSQALSARATTEVRAAIVRDSQTYITEKLDELSWSSNRLLDIADAHPDLPEVRRLRQKTYADPLPLFAEALEGVPAGIDELMLSRSEDDRQAAVHWLNAHEEGLAQIVETARDVRFIFGTATASRAALVVTATPGPILYAEQICSALAARALRDWSRGEHESAIASLNAARSIAVDLGDGRRLHHKGVSILARQTVYQTMLRILNDCDAAAESAFPEFIDCVLNDPPLVRYRLGMVSARQMRSQFLEGAFVAPDPKSAGSLDLDALDALTFGGYGLAEELTDAQRAAAAAITPHQALSALDAFIEELEGWDDIPFQSLRKRARKLYATRTVDAARDIAVRIGPNLQNGFQLRGRVSAMRAASMLSAHLRVYQMRQGEWPKTLSEIAHASARVTLVDPYIGRAWGYKLIGNGPLLYSVNEDGEDNGGVKGGWGDLGTDVVFFAPCELP